MVNTVLERPVSELEKRVVRKTPVAPAPDAQFERFDAIDTPKIVVVGFVAAILTFVVIIVAQAMFFMAADAENVRKSLQVIDTTAEQVVTQQESRLANYRWVNPQAGLIGIPIEDAMRKVVDEEKKKQAAGDPDVR